MPRRRGFGHDTIRRAHTLGGPDALRWGASLGVPLRADVAPSAHYGATGAIYAALYVMFGISLRFSLYLMWQQYEAARLTVEAEAAAVQRLYWMAENYPDPHRSNVQDLAVSYARGRCRRSGL